MFEEIAASWPLDLNAHEGKSTPFLSKSSSFRDLAIAARLGVDHIRLQSALLAKHALAVENREECEILYCWVAYNLSDYRSFSAILAALREQNPSRLEVRILTILGWLWISDTASIANSPAHIWAGEDSSPLLQLCKADYYLKVGELDKAETSLGRLPSCICPEMAMLQATLLSKKGNEQAAIELLLSQLHR